MFRLLTGAVQHGTDAASHADRRLEQQRGLPDTRLAAEQDERPRYDSSSKHSVEFTYPRG
jgi:hypothetical protein